MPSADDQEDEDAAPPPAGLGDLEVEVLRYVSDRAPVTVRAVADDWGHGRGLAKTTVQTVMERLRAKGYLARAKRHGSFEYSPAVERGTVTRRLVHDFVERALGGSFGPLVAYLAERRNLSKEEMDVLERIVRETEAEDAARRADKETNGR